MEDHLLNNEALVNEIASIIINARNNVIKNINTELIDANWNIGCIIVEDELKFQHEIWKMTHTIKNYCQ